MHTIVNYPLDGIIVEGLVGLLGLFTVGRLGVIPFDRLLFMWHFSFKLRFQHSCGWRLNETSKHFSDGIGQRLRLFIGNNVTPVSQKNAFLAPSDLNIYSYRILDSKVSVKQLWWVEENIPRLDHEHAAGQTTSPSPSRHRPPSGSESTK